MHVPWVTPDSVSSTDTIAVVYTNDTEVGYQLQSIRTTVEKTATVVEAYRHAYPDIWVDSSRLSDSDTSWFFKFLDSSEA